MSIGLQMSKQIRTNNMMRIRSVLLQTLASVVLLGKSVSSNCSPCQCLPSESEAKYLLCQGWKVSEFPPLLSQWEKMWLEEIYLVETLITCLPTFIEEDYNSLETFDAYSNDFLNCSCLHSWRNVKTFNSECTFENDTTTAATNTATSSSKPVTTEVEGC